MNKSITVANDCYVQVDGQSVLVGDDMRMNGLDAPARLKSAAEAQALIRVLQGMVWTNDGPRHLDHVDWSESREKS